MRRSTVALPIAVLDIVGYALVSLASTGDTGSDPLSALAIGAAIASFSIMGAVLIRRVPANLVGVLLLATGTAQSAGIAILMYASLGSMANPPWPGAAIVSAFGDMAYIAPFVIALIGVPLVFPDGRLPSRRFRWVAWGAVAGLVAIVVAGFAPLIPGLSDVEAVRGALNVIALITVIIGLAGAGTAIWIRFRRGDPVQREQLKWLLADACVALIALPLAMISGSSETPLALAFWVIGFLAFLTLPIAIGIAILRYRLYEIDRIISRTIGYTIVTVALAAVLAVAVILLEAVLTPITGTNMVAVAASTLLVAALFQPLRRRVQRVVDRRFDRSRYDAERAVAAFVARLRDDVDLESVSSDVLAVVTDTVAPAVAGLWIRRPEVEG